MEIPIKHTTLARSHAHTRHLYPPCAPSGRAWGMGEKMVNAEAVRGTCRASCRLHAGDARPLGQYTPALRAGRSSSLPML